MSQTALEELAQPLGLYELIAEHLRDDVASDRTDELVFAGIPPARIVETDVNDRDQSWLDAFSEFLVCDAKALGTRRECSIQTVHVRAVASCRLHVHERMDDRCSITAPHERDVNVDVVDPLLRRERGIRRSARELFCPTAKATTPVHPALL